MVAVTHTAHVQTDEKDALMFYRDNRKRRVPEDQFEPGAISRFYRFVYPNLPSEQRTHGDWLETLVKRNSWLR